ncbi:MAG: anhydro-N-acetylmuramic acid kinase [Xanthobacteraceae bacterium]
MAVVRAVGMMSGTSLDGVDIALIETDGHRIAAFGPTGYRPYSEAERAVLRQSLAEAATLTDRDARPGILAEAEALSTRVHAEAFEALVTENNLARDEIAVAGFHGQTVLHRPARRLTVQIGNGKKLAQLIRVPVAYDFRAADVAAGGQGAPLVPIFHCALIEMLGDVQPMAVVNIGGVANITYCDEGQAPVACDTGPGNALIDDFLRSRNGQSFDEEGKIAAGGKVDQGFVERVLRNPYFNEPPPKSLDRNEFARLISELSSLSLEDGVATLTMLTAASIARTRSHLPHLPTRFIIAGGGAHNRTLMKNLSALLAPVEVVTADGVGWSSDALEAPAFGYLAVRTLHDLPITFPSTTGVGKPLSGGIIATA